MLFSVSHVDAQSSQRQDIHVSDTSFAENVGNATFEISNRTSGARQITISLVDGIGQTGAAKLGQDYRAITGTVLTFSLPPNGNSPRTITIPIIDDTDREDAEIFGLRVFIAGIGDFDFTMTIEKNDQPPAANLTISPRTVQIPEGQTQAFTVTLSAAQSAEVTVKCQTLDNQFGPVAGEDYDSVDSTLTFAAGVTEIVADTAGPKNENCFLRTIADGVDEAANQTVAFGLSDAAGGDVETDGSGGVEIASGHGSFNVTIVDGDDPPQIWLEQASLADLSVAEGTATFEFTVRMSAASGKEDFAVGYRLSGTATPGYDDQLTPPETGEDYTVSYQLAGNASTPARQVVGTENISGFRRTNGDGHITLFAGETSKTLTVHVNDDQLKEANETIVLELLQDPDPAANTALSLDATNLDDLAVDQTRKTATLTLRSNEGENVNLNWWEFGDAIGEANPNNVTEDSVPEADRTGNDNHIVVFVPVLDIGSTPSTIGLAVREGTAREGVDYNLTATVTSTLNYISFQNTYEGFAIEMVNDDEDEAEEYFWVDLTDTDGNLLAEPLRVNIADPSGLDPIVDEIGKFATARAEALIENQPRLIPMLRDPDERSEFKLRATDRGVEAAGGFRAETVWAATTMSRSAERAGEHSHLLTTLGTHFRMSENLHLGGMLQFDRSGMEPGGQGMSGEIGGNGWMAGPYLAARDQSHPLFFEGRLLYGRASNHVEDFVLSEGDIARSASFDSERWLAQARVEGTYRFESGATLIPLADISHARDEMEPFQDGNGTPVRGQTIAVSKLQLGAEVEIPVETARGDLLLKPGLRFVASDASGEAFSGVENGATDLRLRGRIDFGIDYRLDDDLVLGFGSFYSGLGRKDLETYGAGLDLRLEF